MKTIAVVLLALSLPLSAATSKRLDAPETAAAAAERTVSIDVKDVEVVAILKDMQRQCGVKNLMIDPQVKGRGTFYFHEVPCRQAWGIVLRSLGFHAVSYRNSVVALGPGRNR